MGLATDDAALSNALIAAFNNPDRAVEYLLGGIPDGALARAQAHGKGKVASMAPRAAAGAQAPPTFPPGAHSATLPGGPLFLLRNHPQLSQLKSAIRTSVDNIPIAINAIAQAMPELASAIEANKDAFLQLMNEPEGAAVAGVAMGDGGGGMEGDEEEEDEEGDFGEDDALDGLPGGASACVCVCVLYPEGCKEPFLCAAVSGSASSPRVLPLPSPPPFMPRPAPPADPAALLQMIAGLPAEQQAAAMQQLGIPGGAAGLQQLMQMLGSLQGPGGGGPNPAAGTVAVSLTPEDSAAVDRLVGMGFPKNKVIEAYIACDKNEELAANFLMDSMMG